MMGFLVGVWRRGVLVGWVLALLAGVLPASASAADSVYWANFGSGAIRVGNLGGAGSAQNLFTGETNPEGVAIDSAAGKIYWSDPVFGLVRVGNLNGTGSAQNLFMGESGPEDVAIDPAARKIYWTNYSSGAIRVGNLGGTGSAQNLFTGETNPFGVAIEPTAGKIYWTNYGSGAIRVANLNGTGSPQDLFAGESGPDGVAIDSAAGKIYWADNGSGAIRVGNLGGTGSAQNLFTGESGPGGVAIDPAAGKIYWTNSSAIRVGNLNGTGTAQDLFAGENSPAFLSLLRSPAAAGTPVVAGGSGGGSLLSCSQGQWASDLLGAFLYRAPQSFAYGWMLNGAAIPGANSNTLTASAAGTYACQVVAVNAAGSSSQTSAGHAVAAATISSLKAKIKHHTAKFTFKGATGTTGLQCALIKLKKHGKKPTPHFKSCKSPKSYKHLKRGKYKFEVRAVSGATSTGPAMSQSFTI